MTILQGDVKVPGIKQPVPKWGVAAGLAVTGIAIYIHYRNNQGSGGAAAPAGVSGVVPGAGGGSDPFPWDGTYGNPADPNSMDTATGSTYGDEGGSGLSGAGGGIAGDSGGGTGGPPFASNTAWSAFVLAQDAGQHPNMAEALGLYLEGKVLDADRQSLIYQAIAIGGPVPVNGPGGYPPKLRTAPAGHKGGTTFADNPVKGLKAHPGADSVTISWDKDPHAATYEVGLTNLTRHRNAGHAVITGTSHTFSGLARGDRFEASVLARPAAKGAKPATIDAAPAAPIAQKGR